MANKYMLVLMIAVLLAGGCSGQEVRPVAALTELADAAQAADLPGRIAEEGEGNTYRVVNCPGTDRQYIELAAGGTGKVEYYRELQADVTACADFKVHFLSTQGTGRIKIAAIGDQGQVLNEIGWSITGRLPEDAPSSRWLNSHYPANYEGGWIEGTYSVPELFRQQLTAAGHEQAVVYRLSVETGQGQHALIERMSLDADPGKAVGFTPKISSYDVELGAVFTVETVVSNNSKEPVPEFVVKVQEPYGYGLIVSGPAEQMVAALAPGEHKSLTWQVRAQRPDSVNLHQPWRLIFTASGQEQNGSVTVKVSDPRPGKIFYVMTDDLEPIDSAGYPRAWGNGNGWLDPQEFSVQLIRKAEKLNAISGQYGAKWTHYIAWPAVRAAKWAATQSTTGEWPKVVAAIEQSVASQTMQGHEYGIHMHTDYDPYLEGNSLSYHQPSDGFWANHLRHGWAHSIDTEGDGFDQYNSRTGSLYSYQRVVEELSAGSDQGQILTTRAGSFDFGNGEADEAMSIRAYHKVGLWGSSDADGNEGGITSGSYGQEIYFTTQGDINVPATELSNIGLVEFRPTPRQCISYDSQCAAVMNAKAVEGIARFSNGRGIMPGVHAIVGFTHTMFVLGAGDWQSTEGGQFQEVEDHLAYLKQNYVDQGLLQFATASTLVANYLDYYTPQPVAVYGRRLRHSSLASEYEIKLLGSDIPIDAGHKHAVSLKYPLYLRDAAYRISVLKNGKPVYTTWELPTPFNDIEFVADDATASYTLKVYHNEILYSLNHIIRSFKQKF